MLDNSEQTNFKPTDFLKNFPNYKIQYFQDSNMAGGLPAKHSEVFLQEEAETMQDQFHGVYYSVNGFKHKRTKEDLVSFNGYFVDLDIKKEADIISTEKSQELKAEALNKLTGAPLQPHCIVETKNGYQAVWLISNQPDESIYLQIEKELISYFGADKGGTSITKILRLPGFYHLKNPNDPFLCKLIINNFDQDKFTSDQIIDKFGFILAEDKSEQRQASSGSSFTIPIKTVIEKAAGMVGIKIDFKKNTDGSEQIIENGEVTSGFVSSRGEFVESASGKERRGNYLGVARYYLNTVGGNSYSTAELIGIIKNDKILEQQLSATTEDISEQIIKYGDLLSMKMETVGFLVDGIIPEIGITMLQGHPDARKSWLALYFAYCTLNGRPAFGSLKVKQSNVLIINVDDYLSVIRERLTKLGLGEDLTHKLHIWKKDNFNILKSGEQIKSYVKENNIKLVIFDTFRDIHQANENDSQDMNAVMQMLKNISQICSVLLIHHLNKDNNNNMLSGRGSTLIPGSLISLLTIQWATKDNAIKISPQKNKIGEKLSPFLVRLTNEDGHLTFILVDSKDEASIEEIYEKVTDEVKKAENIFFKKDILEKIKAETTYTVASIERAFDLLEKNKVIERDLSKHQFNKISYRLVSSNSSSIPPQPP